MICRMPSDRSGVAIGRGPRTERTYTDVTLQQTCCRGESGVRSRMCLSLALASNERRCVCVCVSSSDANVMCVNQVHAT